ncbi:MAG: helicase-related protein, partial [Polaribacter sp.]
RDNLAYQIFKIEDKLQRLLQIFSKTKTPAIVYTNSRKKTKEIATFLNKNRFKSSYYHGGLSVDEKKTAFNNWMSEKTPIIVATNAFGMGIDKANVGLVIHYNLPFSIENYVQEAGRAGRNDKKAFAVLLYNSLDISLFKEQTALSTPTIKQIKAIHRALYQYFRISLGEISLESFSFNLLEFSKKYNYAVSLVDTVIKVLSNHGILEIDNNFNRKSTVKFIVSSNSVLNYMNNNTLLSKTINTILRTYGGLFEQESTINEFVIAKKVGTNSVAIINNLKQLHIDKIIDYKPVIGEATITFLVPREDDRSINQNLREIKSLIRQKVKKSEELLHFIENNTICRSKQILHYFDETKTTDCGLCDVCINRKHSSNKDVSIKITALLETNQNLTSQEISRLLSYKEKDILIHLRSLVSDEKISINHQNKYQLNI